MRNIFTKSLLLIIGCLMASTLWAADAVALKPGTYSLTSAAATSGSKKFNTCNDIYYGRNGGGLAGNSGVEVKSGSMFAFKISAASTIKFKVRNSKTKSITDTWSVKAISDADFAGIIAQCEAGTNAGTYYSNSSTEICQLTITQTGVATNYTNETSALQPGCYGFYLSSHSADGDFVEEIVITGSGPVISTDATLKSLTYDGTSVPGFSADKTSYDVELPAGYVGVPSIVATANDTKANVNVTQATSVPGTATIVVTAEDETTKKTYTVTFTRESAAPKVESATWDNILGTAVVDNVNMTITGRVKNGTSLNAITPSFTGKNIQSWTPQGAQNFSAGAVSYIFTSPSSEAIEYSVTITEAPAMSSDATLKSLSVSDYTIAFSPSTYVYNIELKSGTSSAPSVSYELNDSKAQAVKTDAANIPGSTTIKVTAEDGVTILTYTINFTVASPSSDLTIHHPELYEADALAGGYNTELSVANGREYEVYYINRDSGSKFSVSTTNADKANSITDNTGDNSAKAADGWFTISGTGNGGETGAAANNEFKSSVRKLNFVSGSTLVLRVSGFDQFSFYGKDNSNNVGKDEKHFTVTIDGIPQSYTPDKENFKIRRYDLPSGTHLIEVGAVGGSNNTFVAFSLRVAQEPRTKRLGGDVEQSVKQTQSIKDVSFFTKYSSLGETKIVWEGSEATGIGLRKAGSNPLGDTIKLGGQALCPVGEYPFRVVSIYNGNETSSLSGKLTVTSEISALTDTDAVAFQNEAIDAIQFRYYALQPEDITITWKDGNAPEGITGSGVNGKYTISGTPTKIGEYTYTITVNGGNSLHGTIYVKELDLGNDPVLYLFKNNNAQERDGVYKYLKSKGKNLIERKAKLDGLRPAEQLSNYKWILISEDVDADNPEVLAILRGEANLPVLNMQVFAYAPGRMDWGEPNNGSISENSRAITVQRPDHPIFQAMGKKQGDKIVVLDSVAKKGLMPAKVQYGGTLCLATALTRAKDDYYGDGAEETFLHEIPADKFGGQKYICLPIAFSSTNELTAEGKKLLDETVKYLLSTQPSVDLAELKITSFKIGTHSATIDQDALTITMSVDAKEGLDLAHAAPVITLASPMTHVTPTSGETVDLSDGYLGIEYIVSDYINTKVYNAVVKVYRSEDIENVYAVGEWVNVYDIQGRKITTTNENIYEMALPAGIYIISTANGTFKIYR